VYDTRELRGSEASSDEERRALSVEVTRKRDTTDRGRGERRKDRARVLAKQQRRRTNADAHVVRLVLVRVYAVVYQCPEHATCVERPCYGPVHSACYSGPAE
jgi:hypothetical protein